MYKRKFIPLVLLMILIVNGCSNKQEVVLTPVDYVNPYMGNISHLLVPTYPTVHLPNSMLRIYPERADYTSDKIKGLPVIVTSHQESLHSACLSIREQRADYNRYITIVMIMK